MADDLQVSIDRNVFHDRLGSFIAAWKADKRSGDNLFAGAGSVVMVAGKSNDELQNYQKTTAFQVWLLGYEFPATLFIITTEAIHIVTTKKKAAYLEPLKGGRTPVEVHVRSRDHEQNVKQFDECIEIIKTAGKKVGVAAKDSATGSFAEEWKKAFESFGKELEEVDVTTALSSAALAVKDERELRATRDASKASSGLLVNYFVEEMSQILDSGSKTTHKALARKINDKIEDSRFFQGLKVSSSFDTNELTWARFPLIQSGGKYDFRLSAEADDSYLHAGVIFAQIGLRYQSYNSLVARTYMVDPNKTQENNYKLLLSVHNAVLQEIRDGVLAKDVYARAVSVLKSKKADLEKNFVRNLGYGIGIEMRDSSLVLNAKSNRVLKDGMTLSVTTGLTDLQNPDPQDKRSNTYALALTDTVRVTRADTVVFTKDAPTDLESTSFFFKDDEDEPQQKPKPKKDPKVGAVAQQNITKTRLRGERATNQDAEKEAARREHQKELHAKKQQQGLERYGEGTGTMNGTEEKRFKRFESYKRDNQFPAKVRDLIVLVDHKNSTVVLPIMGRPVPFHINTIKNASRTDEGEFTYLRINFLSPGQGVGRKDDQPFEDPTAHFVRSLSFRSRDFARMEEITQQITDLKRTAVRREQEKKEMEDVVEQDKLIEIRNRRPHRLEPIFLRPAMEGKRIAGVVEIHQNGLRYQHPLRNDQRVDVLFSNVKHLFFQPCAHELIVIIHVHLKSPIMIGKRKTRDVQFYREATEMQFDETGNRKRKHRYGDEEEFEAEQEERRRRVALDKEFRNFAERISDAGRNEGISVDIPFRELGFNGVPSRSSVMIQPTTDCLVQLTEPPFLVVTLSEIEVVHLERVQFGLKNFDMVLVFKDFTRPPAHINTIPVESLDSVKDWLDSVDIPFSEGPLNLNWATIMKTVTSDPHIFFAEGGWSFLSSESDSEEDEPEEEESAFEVSDSELAVSDESSEEDSEFDEEASAEDTDGGSGSEESGGEDWDELEKKAKKKDRGSGLDDEEKGKSKRR